RIRGPGCAAGPSRQPPMNDGHSGITSFSPQMKMTHDPTVSTMLLMITSFQLNSSPARLHTITSTGSATAMPMRGNSQPNTPTDRQIVMSGLQAQAPIGSPSSVSMVSASNSTSAPSSASRMPSPNGKYPGPGRAEVPKL